MPATLLSARIRKAHLRHDAKRPHWEVSGTQLANVFTSLCVFWRGGPDGHAYHNLIGFHKRGTFFSAEKGRLAEGLTNRRGDSDSFLP
jgi:hypothetical protein